MDAPEVVFEDDQVLVLNKPPGWVVNSVESAQGPIVEEWLKNKYGFQVERSGVVHRLDKETSGLLLVAKTQSAFENLTAQFAERKVKKKYIALVHGKLPDTGVIEEPLGRLPWNRERFGVLPGGRVSKTTYGVIERLKQAVLTRGKDKFDGNLSLVELQPETGRTHQIRVHLKSIGHPIVSDEFYAGRKTARDDRKWCLRLFLHAGFLGFFHPVSNDFLENNLELPSDLASVLEKLTKVNL